MRFSDSLFPMAGENLVHRMKSWQMEQGQTLASMMRRAFQGVDLWFVGIRVTYPLFPILVMEAYLIYEGRLWV